MNFANEGASCLLPSSARLQPFAAQLDRRHVFEELVLPFMCFHIFVMFFLTLASLEARAKEHPLIKPIPPPPHPTPKARNPHSLLPPLAPPGQDLVLVQFPPSRPGQPSHSLTTSYLTPKWPQSQTADQTVRNGIRHPTT